MQLIRKAKDVIFMARDFLKVVSGKDYFHQPDNPGNYFKDGRSYYIDFRGKVNWTGDYVDNVPVLYFPSMDKSVLFPGMIIQYGLGSIDMYFATQNTAYLKIVESVYAWLIKNINGEHYLDNLFSDLYPNVKYYSNNSAMTQGTALSFLIRVVKHKLVEGDLKDTVVLIENMYRNLILPTNKGGGALYIDDDIYLCEYCRMDGYVVLNGWIFAILGLHDYHVHFDNAEPYLEKCLQTLETTVADYVLPDKWSYYDNEKRLSSHVYQFTHINLFAALYKLTDRDIFGRICEDLQEGYNMHNKIKYTLLKIVDKLRDTTPYSTVR